MSEQIDPKVVEDVRARIDAAKAAAKQAELEPTVVEIAPGVVMNVARKASSSRTEKDPIDPSNVRVTSDPVTMGALVSQLYKVRAEKRALDAQDDAIKQILVDQMGELEYLALAEGEAPVVSAKHEMSVRVKTDAVKAEFPMEDHPEMYTTVSSRPMKLMS